MRMMVDFEFPIEPFNSMVKSGTGGGAIQKALEAINPEAVYFGARNGRRGGTMIVDVPDASWIPKVAEHLFLAFEAKVELHPVMTPEDLANAGLDEIGEIYA